MGCTRATPPSTTATRGKAEYMRAMRPRKRSSAPKTSAGRTMVAPGAAARTAASPAALVRAHSDSENGSAASADTCTKFVTPAATDARASASGMCTFTSAKEKLMSVGR